MRGLRLTVLYGERICVKIKPMKFTRPFRSGNLMLAFSTSFLIALAPGDVRADTVMLRPIADTGLYENQPTSPQGSGGTMISGTIGVRGGNTRRRALLRFDLTSQIPPNATVTRVTLRLNVVLKLPGGGGVNSTFDLRRVLQPWTESGATWNNRMAGVPWRGPEIGRASCRERVCQYV